MRDHSSLFTFVDLVDGQKVYFSIIEDESGQLFWGYGHVDPLAFIAEVNRYLVHVLGPGEEIWSTPDELAAAGVGVEHVWARMQHMSDERFDVVDMDAPGAFPVTRLML